ncbi:tetratricopeptide repeat protein [Pontibacter sp. SGAir0037]|uniref:tetratricopeptide repeat protein n=1 Tax=Pontibacter sp. SGAir0037 TaxID=2571030 RepID=UPI0010CD5809|nr:tetratricopeptide repeat protein [Pontibacter sp. SGAir0037]QCR21326.1 aerotolerance protein [Pontibacter sp. SGAir0037]
MKALFLFVLLISFLGGGLNAISRLNAYTKDAASAYQDKNYTEAIAAYEYLLQNLDVEDYQIRLNLAHSYYQAGQLERAQQEYQLLADHQYSRVRAIALLQLGNIAATQKKYKRALSYCKDVLVLEPENDQARYNYELLKKYLALHPEVAAAEEEEQLPPPAEEAAHNTQQPADTQVEPQPKNRPDSNGDQEEETEGREQEVNPEGKQETGNQQGADQKGQEGKQEREQMQGQEKGNEQGLHQNAEPNQANTERSASADNISEQDQRAQTQRSRLHQMSISPEKAKVLLDAMRNAEMQYIQQLPKKSNTKPDRTKPDW